MDSPAVALLSLEAMGEATVLRVTRSGREPGSCMECGEVSPWRLSRSPALAFALPSRVFSQVGLPLLYERSSR